MEQLRKSYKIESKLKQRRSKLIPLRANNITIEQETHAQNKIKGVSPLEASQLCSPGVHGWLVFTFALCSQGQAGAPVCQPAR